MPSSVTHAYFAQDVLEKLDINISNKLNNELGMYKIFSQGPDPYNFYDFRLSPKAKKSININKNIQHNNINEHFINLINYINGNNFYNDNMVMAYLCGEICHFVLDSTIHPFVIYNTGMYDKYDKRTYKYNGLHEDMEYYIDIYLIWKREKILPRKYKVYKYLFDIKNFNDNLSMTIDEVNKKTYGFDDTSKIYFKAIKDMKNFYYIFNYDPIGIKKFFYTILDLICPGSFIKKKELSFNVVPYKKLYYLNEERNVWNHPCNINEQYDYSFAILYNLAIKKAVDIINEIDNMLVKKKINNKKIKDLFKNSDYATGKDCDLDLDIKYFKF